MALAETAKPVFLGPEYPVWSDRIEREHNNVREVLYWAWESGEVCTGLRLVGALSWFWWMSGYLEEGRRWAEELLWQPVDEDRPGCGLARAGALCAAGELAFGQGDLAVAALGRGDIEGALALNEESLSIYRELGDSSGIALAMINLGDVARERGEAERATTLYDEALNLYRELGNGRGVTRALARLAGRR